MIIGGAGGVGSIAIQIARHVAGLTVIATASRKESIEWCRSLGADHVIDHRQPLLAQLKTLGVGDVDYILCFNDTEAGAEITENANRDADLAIFVLSRVEKLHEKP